LHHQLHAGQHRGGDRDQDQFRCRFRGHFVARSPIPTFLPPSPQADRHPLGFRFCFLPQ
jgi:hypothetical protein